MESRERIRRTLRHYLRKYADERYCNGDKVYYIRNNFKGWKGPGVVLGQDEQYVLVRHGGAYYRVHPCQFMKIHDARKPCSSDTSTKTTSSSCMSGGGSSDCVNIDFSNKSINQRNFDYNEDGILLFEQTEDDVDEETNNEDGFLSSDVGNTAQSKSDLSKDGVLSAEDTGNAEGTIVNEDCEQSARKTDGARKRVVSENSISTEEQRGDPAVWK